MKVLCLKSETPEIEVGSFYSASHFEAGGQRHLFQFQVGSERTVHLPIVDFMFGFDKIPDNALATLASIIIERTDAIVDDMVLEQINKKRQERAKVQIQVWKAKRQELEREANQLGIDFQSTVSFPRGVV